MQIDDEEVCSELEHRFHITFDRAKPFETAGELADYIAAKIGARPSPVCPTAEAFYQLRSTIQLDFNIPEDQITPRTGLRSIVKSRDPRRAWKRLAKAVNLQLPDLNYPEELALIAAPCMFAAIILPLALACIFDHSMTPAACVGLPLSILLIILVEHLLRPILARRIPRHLQTLEGLAILAAANSPAKTVQTIWSTVQITLAQSAAINPRRIRRRTTFVEIAALC